jgi:putative phosphoesterase
MRFLVASDSHGRISALLDMVAKGNTHRFPADGIIFLGDGIRDLCYLEDLGLPIFPVAGNCDMLSFGAPKEEILSFDGYRILITHSDRYGVKGGEAALVSHAAAMNADVVLYGHTHLPSERYYSVGTEIAGTELQKPITVMNPGSIRECGGGFPPGYGVLELTSAGVLWSRVALI